MQILGVSPFLSRSKSTPKQQSNSEKLDIGYLSATAIVMLKKKTAQPKSADTHPTSNFLPFECCCF